MDREVEIAGHRVRIAYKRVKNINMRLQACPQGGAGIVSVSAPRRVPLRDIAAFVVEKSNWIETNMAKLLARAPAPISYAEGALHPLWGQDYPLHIETVGRGQKAVFDGASWRMAVRADAPDEKRASLLEAVYQQELHAKAGPLMAHWAALMGLQPQLLKTQKMKSRWGSCHVSKGIIKLNSELARKPATLLEYVLVHELVHLYERGHNARFYAYMDKYLPDWRARKQRLNATAC